MGLRKYRYKQTNTAANQPATCPDELTLARYIDGLLDREKESAIEAHVQQCIDCQFVVDLGNGGETDFTTKKKHTSDDTRSRDGSIAANLEFLTKHKVTALGPGTQVGKYIVTGLLGQGGMGVVYRAIDQHRDTVVALKFVKSPNANSLYRFKREFRTLAGVPHRNLVTLHELFAEQEKCYFAMEFIDGVDFLSYVRGRNNLIRLPRLDSDTEVRSSDNVAAPLRHSALPTAVRSIVSYADSLYSERTFARPLKTSTENQLRIRCPLAEPLSSPEQFARLRIALRQLVSGVMALHDSGHLHRDLKPSNIMVDRDDRLVILDFGLAKEVRTTGDLSGGQIVVEGTPSYMAPEQAFKNGAISASDWYGVGTVLYETLTGRRPFPGLSIEVLKAKLHGDPQPPRIYAPSVPEELNQLCVDLLAREPNSRPTGVQILKRIGESRAIVVQSRPRGDSSDVELIGRETYQETLSKVFASVRAGRARTVLVEGGSGVGKSALVSCFLSSLRQVAVVLDGRCYERESVPYKGLDSVIDALAEYLLSLPSEDVKRLLPESIRALSRLFPVLESVREISEAPLFALETSDSHEIRQRAFSALRELLARLSTRRPIVVWIDDGQWGDVDSARALSRVLCPPDTPAMLLIVSHRTKTANTGDFVELLLDAQPDALHLSVQPLSLEKSKQLAATILGTSASDPRTETVARESGGNPFFVTQLAWHLGNDSFAPETDGVTLEALLQKQYSRLPAYARTLLEVVAVAGCPLRQGLAFRAAELAGSAWDAVTVLKTAKLVTTTGPQNECTIESFHDRIRETVFAGLSNNRRKKCYRQLATLLESEPDVEQETLATYWRGAGHLEKAGRCFVKAAERATHVLAFDRAADLYGQALECAPVDDETRRILFKSKAESLAHAGRGLESAQAYSTLADLCEASQAAMYSLRSAERLVLIGDLRKGWDILEREFLAPDGLRMPRTRRGALIRLIWERIQLSMKRLEFCQIENTQVSRAERSRLDLYFSICVVFQFTDNLLGAAFMGRHLRRSLAVGDSVNIARGLVVYSATLALRGPVAKRQFEAIWKRAFELAQGTNDAATLGMLHGCKATCHFLFGEWRQGLVISDETTRMMRNQGTDFWFTISTQELVALFSLFYLGEAGELTRRASRLLQEAWDRNDLYLATSLSIGRPAFSWLVRDDPHSAHEVAAEAMKGWTRLGYTLQDYFACFARCNADLYLGNYGSACQRVENEYSKIRTGGVTRLQTIRVESSHLRARCALACSSGVSKQKPPPGYVQRIVRSLGREGTPYAKALASLLQAGVAGVSGDRELARELLHKAASHCDDADMGLYATAARYHLGRLVGGDQGAEIVESAEDKMRHQEILDPERISAVLVPGFDNIC